MNEYLSRWRYKCFRIIATCNSSISKQREKSDKIGKIVL